MQMRHAVRYIFWAALLLVAGPGCALRPALLPEQLAQDAHPAAVELNGVPHFTYDRSQCGPAALASVLAASGVHVFPEELSAQVYIPDKKGSLQPEIMAACRRHGRLPYRIAPDLTGITGELRHGRPVLVLTNLGLSVFPVWHYAVVIGYDLKRDRLLLRSADNPRESVPARLFLRTWKRAECWGIVALRPDELPVRPDPGTYFKAVADMEEVGMLRESRTAYENALMLWPEQPVGLFGLGNTAYAMGDLKSAETAFRQLMQVQPENMAAVNNLAVVLGELGNYKEALRLISGALAFGPAGTDLRQMCIQTRDTLLEQMHSDHPASR